MARNDDGLVKIYIELPQSSEFGSESFWAKPLGDDLYKIRNSPWYAYDLHFYDVVRAIPDEPDGKPKILEVVRRGGHKTLRVFFDQSLTQAQQLRLLKKLQVWKAFHEHAGGHFWAVDVEPDGHYQAVCDKLWEWEQAGKLQYETGVTKEEPG
jgi:hypothetical protein